MSDEHPCEYWVTQWELQRLLSLIRQSQSHCTDTECLNVSRFSESQNNQQGTDFFWIFVIMAFMMLYLFRPNFLRSTQQKSTKINEIFDNNNDPPGPPPTTN